MSDIQAIMNALSGAMEGTRQEHMVTTKRLLEMLEVCPPENTVRFDDGSYPGNFGSYRGYYSDLSIEPSASAQDNLRTVALFSAALADTIGQTYDGYKGGDFTMHEMTPLWVSSYGDNSGIAITHISNNDGVTTIHTRQTKD